MSEVEGAPVPLLRVTTDHAATGLMRGRVAEALPIEHSLVLVGEAAVWVGVGVDKEIPLSLIEGSARLQKLPVPCGNALWTVRSIRVEGRAASGTDPIPQIGAILSGAEHHDHAANCLAWWKSGRSEARL